MNAFADAFAGLDAQWDAPAQTVLRLSIDSVVEDPGQPREQFDLEALRSLALTVRDKGVLQPITVWPQDAAGRYVIRFGARRHRAARIAGLPEIPALIRGGLTEAADQLIEQVIENDQRAPLTTAELAATVGRLLALGRNQKSIGVSLGRPKDQIAMLAAVNALPSPLDGLGEAMGLRGLYELVKAWRADGPAVEQWLEGRDPETITQAQSRQLYAQITASARPSRARPARTHVLVRVEDRPGVLVLRPSVAAGQVWVRFLDALEPISVAIASLVVIGVEAE